MVSVQVNLTNKWLYFLAGVLIVSVLGIGVYAYNSGANPSVMGHSLNEVELPNCAVGQALVKNTSGWTCGDMRAGVNCSFKYVGTSGLNLQQAIDDGSTGFCYFFHAGSGHWKLGHMGLGGSDDQVTKSATIVGCDEDSFDTVYTNFFYYTCLKL